MTTQTETLRGLNISLLNNSKTVATLKEENISTTKEVIRYLLNSINDDSVVGKTKKDKINFVLKMELEGLTSKQFHPNFKLSVKVARLKLIDGLKIRDDLLTLGQLKTLIDNFKVETINYLFDNSTIDTYIETIKNHIQKSKIEVSTKKVIGDKPKRSKK
ncbi:MAG: hypothetical protein JHC33_06160 [Ignisphaera sp.]|nr:hypothetical protein [Ignisphaera sp.]